MANALIQTSFAAGELSPSLYSRVDLAKYGSGAALLRNFYVDYRGGASTRPGTQFIGACLDGHPGIPHLIPFVVSTIASYVLELGDHYIRFISNGAFVIDPGTGLPLVVASPYAIADVPQVKFTQSADVLTLTHQSYPVYNLTRTSPTTFTLAPDAIGPVILAPVTVNGGYVGGMGTDYAYGYVFTAVADDGEESAPSFPVFVEGDILDQNTGKVNTFTYSTSDGAAFYNAYKVGPFPSRSGGSGTPAPTVFGYIGSSATTAFTDDNIAPDFSRTPPTFQDPFAPGQVASLTVIAPGVSYPTGYVVPLTFTGDGSGAAGYAVIDTTNDNIPGVVLTNPGKNYTTCVVHDTDANTAVYGVTLGQQSGTYPGSCGYFQQRRVFGGTANFPEALVMSQPGAYNNFDTSPIQLATDAITVSVASRQVNAIQDLVAMNTGLVVFTTGGGFLVSGGGSNDAVTPSNVVAFPQASPGANDLVPLVVNSSILYGQNRGSVVRDMVFNFYVQAYTGTDRSVLASHLFNNYTLKDWTYAEEPFRLVTVVRSDGKLLAFTYVPEQEIFAWTQYDTFGFFRSIASVPEGQINAVYTVVQRLVGGVYVNYIERFASGLFNTLQDAWCLDCAQATPNVLPAADLTLGAVSGTGVSGVATAGVFAPGDVGKTIWGNHGWATVASYINSTHITVDIISPFDPITDAPTVVPAPLLQNAWYLNPNVTTLSGLGHLEGCTVSAVADGMPVTGLTVAGGSVHLPNPASIIIVGLPYVCQLQTLKVDTGEPTSQGKRKLIAAVTARVNRTNNLEVGTTFSNTVPMKELIPTHPWHLITTDARTVVSAQWNKNGQLCFQQSLPLPATILGLIPEITLGDTMR